MNRVNLLAACLLMLTSGGLARLSAQTPAEHPVDGAWHIMEGTQSGREYGGNVYIESLGSQKTLTWDVGGITYGGIGFYQDGTLYVGWGTGPSYGIVLYTIRPDGSLDGTWIYAGSDEVPGTEHAIGGSIDEDETLYTINGINPGEGKEYSGTMSVVRTGETYRLHWEVGEDSYSGVGLRIGNRLVVGWGGESNDFGVTAYAVEADRAVGRRGVAGRPETGTEILGRVVVATPGE